MPLWHTVHLQVAWTFNTVSPSSASRQTIWYLIAPCNNLALRLLLQVNGGCARTRPAVSCGAKEEAHFEGELRLGGGDQGGHRGGHWDGQVSNVGSLDVTRYTWVYMDVLAFGYTQLYWLYLYVLEQRPEQFARLAIGEFALSPLVANPPDNQWFKEKRKNSHVMAGYVLSSRPPSKGPSVTV